MFRIGIIGCGSIANHKHMPSLSKVEDAQMVAFCDLIPERAAQAAAKFGGAGAFVCADYRELLSREDIDVIHVCTPNISHCEISIAAMEAGKHVMCEKPMAKTASDARRMLEASKKTGRTLSIGYQGRGEAEQLYARRLVEEGALGDIYYARAIALRRRGVPNRGLFLNKQAQGGGPLIDIATHSVDRVLWLTNNYGVSSVTGSVYQKLGRIPGETNDTYQRMWDPAAYEVEDSAFAFVTFKNGMTMSIECAWMVNLAEDQFGSITLCGTKAGLDFSDGLRVNGSQNGSLYINKYNVQSHQRPRAWGKALSAAEYEARQWIESLKTGAPPLVLPEQAVVVSEILEAVYQSAETGKTIYFK